MGRIIEDAEDEVDYPASLHKDHLQIGYTLFSERIPGAGRMARLLLAPSMRIEDIVAVSSLMSPDHAAFDRIPVGTGLAALNETCRFLSLACLRGGVTGMFQQVPEDTTDPTRRLLEICPHYGTGLQASHGKPWENADDVTAVQNELNDSDCFHFSWD